MELYKNDCAFKIHKSPDYWVNFIKIWIKYDLYRYKYVHNELVPMEFKMYTNEYLLNILDHNLVALKTFLYY